MKTVLPELWLIVAMCSVLLAAFVNRESRKLPALTAIVGLALALIATVVTLDGVSRTVFHGTLTIDPFSQLFKLVLLAFVLLIVFQWMIHSQARLSAYDGPDFLCLLLGATTGMALMASASNLLMIFIAIETASLPSFALVGFDKLRRKSTEGSLKYVIFGTAASAVSLYGMSLIYGAMGSLDLSVIAQRAAMGNESLGMAPGLNPLAAAGLLGMFAGFAFKLSAVPLHFWCPDVFEGAPIEVTTFLSVASKGAAICLVLRVLLTFGAMGAVDSDLFMGMAVAVAILGGITATWGNLVALWQTNIKRLLAYSSIAHAGYMIMTASLIVFAGRDASSTLTAQDVAGAILFYLLVYALMNLGAFTVAMVIAVRTGHEDIREYAGMSSRCPILAVLMVIFLISLVGLPPLGGFMAKITLMVVMAKAGMFGWTLIVVLLLNTLVSLYYYARPLYYMILQPAEDRPSVAVGGPAVAIMSFAAACVLWLGVMPGPIASSVRDFAVMHLPALHADVLIAPVAQHDDQERLP